MQTSPTPAVSALALPDRPASRATYQPRNCHLSELLAAIVGGGNWSRKKGPQEDKHPTEKNLRWKVYPS